MKMYLVGGSVRDYVITGKYDRSDNDIVVIGSSVDEMLGKGFRHVGESFPVFLHDDYPGFEFALARKEKKVGLGYGGFNFDTEGVSLEEDLARRDLTMNAMAVPYEKMNDFTMSDIIDPYDGIVDIKNQELKFISKEAFMEDPLRILRVFRLSCRYDYALSEKMNNAIIDMINDRMLDQISNNRIVAEMRKVILHGYDDHVPLNDVVNWKKSNLRAFNEFLRYCVDYGLFEKSNFFSNFDRKKMENSVNFIAAYIKNFGRVISDLYPNFKLTCNNVFTLYFGAAGKKYVHELTSDIEYIKRKLEKQKFPSCMFGPHSNDEKALLTFMCFLAQDDKHECPTIHLSTITKAYNRIEKLNDDFVKTLLENDFLGKPIMGKVIGQLSKSFREKLVNDWKHYM